MGSGRLPSFNGTPRAEEGSVDAVRFDILPGRFQQPRMDSRDERVLDVLLVVFPFFQ